MKGCLFLAWSMLSKRVINISARPRLTLPSPSISMPVAFSILLSNFFISTQRRQSARLERFASIWLYYIIHFVFCELRISPAISSHGEEMQNGKQSWLIEFALELWNSLFLTMVTLLSGGVLMVELAARRDSCSFCVRAIRAGAAHFVASSC